MGSALKLGLYILAGLLVGLALMWALWSFDPFHRRERAEAKAIAAEQGASLATDTARITERTYHTETVIREKADPIVQTIEAAPGADTPVPDDVLSAFHAGIVQLRDDPATTDHPGS